MQSCAQLDAPACKRGYCSDAANAHFVSRLRFGTQLVAKRRMVRNFALIKS
jgi:hypothetical protein